MRCPAGVLTIFAITVSVPCASAQDWPQYHGPSHNRTVAGKIRDQAWPETGPRVAWRVKTNRGFSSVVVAHQRAFTLVTRDGKETCLALAVSDGDELWATPVGRAKYDGGGDAGARGNDGGDGPRSTPSIDDDRVYVFDAQLGLHCLAASDGKPMWEQDLLADFAGRNIPWQNAASPLVDGAAVFVAGGGPGESLIAFDKKSGDVLWKDYDERMTHATPIVATLHGVRQIIFYVRKGLIAVAPKTGKTLWRVDYPYRTSTAASPVVDGNVVYCSAGYGVGAAAFEIAKDDAGFAVKLLWRKPNRLMNHWSTPVAKDGYLYGMFSFKKYGKGPFLCVDIRTGKTQWSVPGFGPGNCILVGNDLLALSDKGELVVAAAKPDAYEELARADILRGKCWSTPVYADGQIYARSTVEAVRVDVSGGATDEPKK